MPDPVYPEEWEFISFFEAEPSYLDPIDEVPWVYNRPTYQTRRGDYAVTFALYPASSQFELKIICNERPIIVLCGERIERMKINTLQSSEQMVITFEKRGSPLLLDLVLNVKPHVSVSWGTERS